MLPGQDWTSCTIEWDSERDLPIVPQWTPSSRTRTMTVGDRHALLAAAIVVVGAATLVAGAAVVSRQK